MCDHTSTELDADGQVVHRLKSFVGELQQQARLADAGVADYDILEQVGIRHLGTAFTERSMGTDRCGRLEAITSRRS